jgi:hypothetical protein
MAQGEELLIEAVQGGGPPPAQAAQFQLNELVKHSNHLVFTDVQMQRLQGGVLDVLSANSDGLNGRLFPVVGQTSVGADSLVSDKALSLIEARKTDFGRPSGIGIEVAPRSPELEAMSDLMGQMIMSTVKLKVAWGVIQGISKDIKMMLQAQ